MANRCKRALTGVATPWSAPRRTIFAVQELGLNRPRTPGQALPTRSPGPLAGIGGAHLKVVGPPLPVLLGRGHIDGGGGQRLVALSLSLLGHRGVPNLGPAQRLGGVGQVHEELAVFPAHDVGTGHRLERGGVEGIGDVLPHGIDPVGIAAEVQQSRDGRRVGLDHPGAQMGGRAHDAHAVGVGEVPKHPALVLHAVLHADHRGPGRGHGHQLGQGSVGVLPLDREKDDRVVGPGHLGRGGDDRDGQRDRLIGRLEHQPRAQRVGVGPPRHERDLRSRLEEAAPDQPPDGTRTENDEAHAPLCHAPRAKLWAWPS